MILYGIVFQLMLWATRYEYATHFSVTDKVGSYYEEVKSDYYSSIDTTYVVYQRYEVNYPGYPQLDDLFIVPLKGKPTQAQIIAAPEVDPYIIVIGR